MIVLMNSKVVKTTRLSKEEREKLVLMSCIEHYIQTSRAVGSNTLKDEAFKDLSSATIRNYFAHLEEEGYLVQLHASGGRIPTDKGWRWYAEQVRGDLSDRYEPLLDIEADRIAPFLQEALEWLSKRVKGAAFLTSPRFDHDYIIALKPVLIDPKRCLFACVTQFGQVQTEILPVSGSWSQHRVMRLERYLRWRLSGSAVDDSPKVEEEEAKEDERIYQELMLRYIVSYSTFNDEELFRCGFSELLHSEDLKDPALLAGTLSLFENRKGMRHLLRDTMKHNRLQVWVGQDLAHVHEGGLNATLIGAPYSIGNKNVGAVALLGPNRIDYRDWMETLTHFTQEISKKLTEAVYKYQISYRMPDLSVRYLPNQERLWIEDYSKTVLLEDKR